MNWLYEGREISTLSDFPENTIGFVYRITNKETGKFYIGKKILHNNLTKKLTKKETSEWSKPGRIPKKTKVKKESNWLDYCGSSKPLQEDIKSQGIENFVKEILVVCQNKRQLSYYEVYWQMKSDCLSVDSYNENILGKYYRRDVIQSSPELAGSAKRIEDIFS